jgi:DNA repair exonuclease SbcCD nuclease subunit
MLPMIGDLHLGEGRGSELVMKHQLDYLAEVFIPYLLKNNIKVFLQTGDLFDVRPTTNTFVLSEWKRRFFNPLEFHGIQMYTIIGNHDMFYKNKISPNSITEHLSGYSNITIIDKVTEIKIDGVNILFCPWICDENEEHVMDAIQNSDADVCFGHFEVKGARMESSVCTDGLAISTFNRFKLCISGHFHSAGKYDNIQYLGTCYQMTWGDFGHEKGFWNLDTSNLEMEFIKNNKEIYHRITYNENKSMDAIIEGVDYRDQHIKVTIEDREDFNKYEAWFMKLDCCGAATLTVIEPFIDRDGDECDVDVEGELTVQSTKDLIKEYVDQIYPERKDALTKLMLSIHSTAQKLNP